MSGKASILAAAAWMQSEIDTKGMLYQDDAVHEMITRFGESCHGENDNGSIVIAKPVLAAFNKLNASTVVWERGERLWRTREVTDDPGRMQP